MARHHIKPHEPLQPLLPIRYAGGQVSLSDLYVYANDPVSFAARHLHFHADPVQAQVLDPLARRGLLCCCRGWGKTEITAVSTVHHSLTRDHAVTLIVSETAEKAGELVDRAVGYIRSLGLAIRPDGVRRHGWRLPNGSRILPVPQRDGGVRGFRATKIVCDESAHVRDDVFHALLGTLAARSEQCSVWILGTPGPRAGFFHDYWHDESPDWLRLWVPATACSRIAPAHIEEMRRRLPPDVFERDVMARWAQAAAMLFADATVQAAVTSEVTALSFEKFGHYRWLGDQVLLANGRWVPRQGFYVAVDLGQARDFSTIAVLEHVWQPTRRIDPMTRHQYCALKLRLRWLSRLPLHTPYTDVAVAVARTMKHPELEGRATAIIDCTGNRAFLDLLKDMKVPAQGVQLTGGQMSSTSPDGIVNLPKGEAMMNMEALLRLGDLQLAADLPLLPELRRELRQFERVQLPGGRFWYSGKTHGSDDLVMAVALGVGWAWERHRAGFNLAGRLRSEVEWA